MSLEGNASLVGSLVYIRQSLGVDIAIISGSRLGPTSLYSRREKKNNEEEEGGKKSRRCSITSKNTPRPGEAVGETRWVSWVKAEAGGERTSRCGGKDPWASGRE